MCPRKRLWEHWKTSCDVKVRRCRNDDRRGKADGRYPRLSDPCSRCSLNRKPEASAKMSRNVARSIAIKMCDEIEDVKERVVVVLWENGVNRIGGSLQGKKGKRRGRGLAREPKISCFKQHYCRARLLWALIGCAIKKAESRL
jgi:hypothetical protein